MENGKKVDQFNRIMLMTPKEVLHEADRCISAGGYLAGTDQWLIWEAIYNLARAITEEE